MDRLLIVSTCGTSLLTYGASSEDRRWLIDIANQRTLTGPDEARLQALEDARRRELAGADAAQLAERSAELAGVHATLARWPDEDVSHLLVHTDTAVGKVATELVSDCLSGSVVLQTAPGLRTDSTVSFRAALAELTRDLDKDLECWRRSGYRVIFNLTAGFKALNAYLQALGMIHADRCVFLFQRSPELMEIPRLPVELAGPEQIRPHLDVFRRLAAGYRLSTEDTSQVPESLLLEVDREVVLSVWGELVWGRVRGDLLGDELLSPLSSKVVVEQSFKRDFGGLESKRKVEVHKALDAVCAHQDGEIEHLPAANRRKPLQGNPVEGCTHEIYGWSDGEAGRLFARWDGGRATFKKIREDLT